MGEPWAKYFGREQHAANHKLLPGTEAGRKKDKDKQGAALGPRMKSGSSSIQMQPSQRPDQCQGTPSLWISPKTPITQPQRDPDNRRSWKEMMMAQNYQALDDLQQLLHDHSNALVAQEPTDGFEVRWPHEIAIYSNLNTVMVFHKVLLSSYVAKPLSFPRGRMNIEVHNITYTSATVSWAMSSPCPENYYHVMYRPNWNSVFAGYLRQNFHREERVPHPLSSLVLHRLTPSTIYVLCITCKNSYPSSNHCTTFHTLDKIPLVFGGSKHEPTTSMWMVSSLLLLCFLALLAYGCLQFWSARCHWAARLKHPNSSPEEVVEGSGSPEEPLRDGLREELLEVPMTTVLMRSSSSVKESPYNSPHCFFSYKNKSVQVLTTMDVRSSLSKRLMAWSNDLYMAAEMRWVMSLFRFNPSQPRADLSWDALHHQKDDRPGVMSTGLALYLDVPLLEQRFVAVGCLSEGLPQGDLGKVLQGSVDGVADGLVEDTLHPPHQHLQPFDHGNHLKKKLNPDGLAVFPWAQLFLPNSTVEEAKGNIQTTLDCVRQEEARQLRDEADVVVPDLHHLLTDVVLGADAALSARPPGQKSNGVKDRTQLPLRHPRDSCSPRSSGLQARHPRGQRQPVPSLWISKSNHDSSGDH
ncbi:hypothetical protein IHE44_0003883 [Lamprotornis superbus]|uniref:Fibronectin type-III domain-containing protein n=1 Tax=Lamprotornis superbus TaxID=245042 RepID=A0A835TZ20_9PASS|nr:hypothetical protein IHE44_0003883 [Lamprotornis superbus]